MQDSNEVARSLRGALSKLNRRLRTQDEAAGVGSTGLALLGRLFRDGPSTAAALALQERLQPQSLTRTLRTLEDRRLISRVVDSDDRRRSRITITKDGADLLHESVRGRESWLASAISTTLTPTERDVLHIAVRVLERLADADEIA